MSDKVVVKDTSLQLTAYHTFHIEDYPNLEQLEQGGEGCCYKAKCSKFGILNRSTLLDNQSNGEIQMLLQVNAHPNVIRLFGLVEETSFKTYGYVMEYMQGGSLHKCEFL